MPSSLDAARTGNSTADLKQAILDNLYFIQGPSTRTGNAARLVHGVKLHGSRQDDG